MHTPDATRQPGAPRARPTLETALDRLHARVVAAPWLRLFTALTRGLLAVGFVPPGMKKVLGLPFTALPVSTPVGAFFAAFFQAPGYYRLVGVVQVVAALLLLVPRTAPLGAVLYFPVIVNIFAITVSIGFGGTSVVTGAMLLANAYLLAWDYDRWKALLPGFAPAVAPPDPARDLGAGWIAVAGAAGLAAFAAAAVGASALAGGGGSVRRGLLAGACLATALALAGVLVRRHVLRRGIGDQLAPRARAGSARPVRPAS